jgi:hypothetical protein
MRRYLGLALVPILTGSTLLMGQSVESTKLEAALEWRISSEIN